MKAFKSSRVHPGAWWLLGLAVAFFAGASSNPATLALVCLALIALILFAREQNPWSQSLRFYLVLALAIILIRLAFRIIFNYGTFDANPADNSIALSLPSFTLNLGALGSINFLGQVSFVALGAAFIDGLRMAAIVLSLGMSNSLANPRKLLKATPGELYTVASALAIAVNLAPQIIASSQRVNRARQLRGRSQGLGAMRSLVIPVLEDTIDKSLSLAASMDARGFGRRGSVSAVKLAWSRVFSFLTVTTIGIGSYLLLTADQILITGCLFLIGLGSAVIAIQISNKNLVRTHYSKLPWRWNDFTVLAAALIIVLSGFAGANQ